MRDLTKPFFGGIGLNRGKGGKGWIVFLCCRSPKLGKSGSETKVGMSSPCNDEGLM